jgi:pimeloyl-ACP methyl ester carboxylesterase
MVDFDRSPWRNIHADLGLYRYSHPVGASRRAAAPILMLHGPMTSHRTWDNMAEFLARNGFKNLYAADIADVQMGGSLKNSVYHLAELVYWLVEQHASDGPLVLIGHSTGGVLARRFLLKTPELAPYIAFVFSLGSPHTRTHFSYKIYVPTEAPVDDKLTSGTMQAPDSLGNTFLVNIFGNAVGQYFDGTVHGVLLPEAINEVMPLRHAELKSHPTVLNEILAYLRGQHYRMQLYLQSMCMKTPDQGDQVGPFYFEVNGMRSPFDGIFQAQANYSYTFDESSTPLATLSYPPGQTLASTVFRLKDLSRTRPIRRRLFAKLLDSLGSDEIAVHEMQDNEGSQITVRVHTQRMPVLLNYD